MAWLRFPLIRCAYHMHISISRFVIVARARSLPKQRFTPDCLQPIPFYVAPFRPEIMSSIKNRTAVFISTIAIHVDFLNDW
jgi:hypothetical protein